MKKNIGLFAILLALVGMSIAGDGKIFSVGDATKYFRVNSDGTAEISGVLTTGGLVGTVAPSSVTGTAITRTTAAQSDTNVTTTTTSYTPVFVGQVLVGGKGTGTNAVWIAKGVTTNDWVQVAP